MESKTQEPTHATKDKHRDDAVEGKKSVCHWDRKARKRKVGGRQKDQEGCSRPELHPEP